MIPITKPVMDEAEVAAARRVVMSGWISQGREVAAFEEELAEYLGAPYACAVSNCTTALHLALVVAGVGPGDEVVTVSHSFVATASCIRYCGATPVFVDIDPLTFNLDPARLQAAISERTRAILCVHQMGMPCDIERIAAIGRQRGIPVIEDAACALGSEIDVDAAWQRIGRPHGDAACFSFHPRKVVSTGEGGLVTTRHREWDEKLRLLRQHGMSVPDSVRHGSSQVIFESYPVVGYNYRMTDLQAAIGREQLKRLPELVGRRRALAARYLELLGDVPGLGLPAEPPWARSNWQSYCVRLPAGADQRAVMQSLLDSGVSTRRGIMCSHLEPSYADLPVRYGLEESERARDECILLPLYPLMTEAEQDKVAGELQPLCGAHAARVA